MHTVLWPPHVYCQIARSAMGWEGEGARNGKTATQGATNYKQVTSMGRNATDPRGLDHFQDQRARGLQRHVLLRRLADVAPFSCS